MAESKGEIELSAVPTSSGAAAQSSIVVISTQAGGKGDLIFGCKLAKFLQLTSGRKVYLINAVPLPKDDTTLAVNAFDRSISFDSKRIDLIHFVFNENGEQAIKAEDQIVDSIEWMNVSQIFIGPSHNYNGTAVLPELRFKFLLDNVASIKNKPIHLMTEYSFECQIQTLQSELKYHKFDNIKIHRTGLGAEEMGVFFDAMPLRDENPSLYDTNKKVLLDGLAKELDKKEYKHPKDNKDSFCQDGLNIDEIRNKFEKFDRFSIYYSSNPDIDHFERFFDFHELWVKNGKYEEPFVLVIGEHANYYLKWSNGKVKGESTFIFLKTLDFSALQAFYSVAKNLPGIGGCTGDQSLSDTLSAKLIPAYQASSHKKKLSKNLADYCLAHVVEGIVDDTENIEDYLKVILFDYNPKNYKYEDLKRVLWKK